MRHLMSDVEQTKKFMLAGRAVITAQSAKQRQLCWSRLIIARKRTFREAEKVAKETK